MNALSALYEQLPDEAVRGALEKLTRQEKADAHDLSLSGNILVDSGTWGDAYGFSDTLNFLESATEARACVDMTYVDREGTVSRAPSNRIFSFINRISGIYTRGAASGRTFASSARGASAARGIRASGSSGGTSTAPTCPSNSASRTKNW